MFKWPRSPFTQRYDLVSDDDLSKSSEEALLPNDAKSEEDILNKPAPRRQGSAMLYRNLITALNVILFISSAIFFALSLGAGHILHVDGTLRNPNYDRCACLLKSYALG